MSSSDDIGLPKGTVLIRDYREEWPRLFERERSAIAAVIGDDVLAIEHVGSTSVPGLAAKPIIDIAIAVTSFEAAAALVAPLEGIGYVHRGEFGIPRRRYFVRGEPRLFHIHMNEATSADYLDHLRFRDALRADVALARRYAQLKRQLAARYPTDRLAYTEAKTAFIREAIGG